MYVRTITKSVLLYVFNKNIKWEMITKNVKQDHNIQKR
jgi:hypothetical protein